MRTAITLLIVFFAGFQMFAQSDFPEFDQSSGKQSVLALHGSILGGSDYLNMPFVKAYYNSGFLDQSLKEKAFDQLKNLNHLGVIFGLGISYQKSGLSKGPFHQIRLIAGHEDIVEAKFDEELFGLYFFGNKRYENIRAQFDNSSFDVLRYQYLKFGADRKIGKWMASGQIGLAFGQEMRELKINKGSLFTAEGGKSLELDLELKSIFTDQENKSLLSIKGIGIVSDWALGYQLNEVTKISVGINRLGFIRWNDQLTGEQVDTNYFFDGLAVNNLFDSIYVELKSEEALENQFLEPLPNVNKNIRLPFEWRLNFQTLLMNRKIFLSSSVAYMPSRALGAFGAVRCSYHWTPWLWAGVSGGFGIYNSWNLGVSCSAYIKGYRLDIDSNSLVNWLLADQAASVNGQIRVSRYF